MLYTRKDAVESSSAQSAAEFPRICLRLPRARLPD